MRKIWLISIIAFVFLAMAACAGMHTASGERVFRARGTVEAYEPGKMLRFASKLEVEGYSDEGDVQNVSPSTPEEFTFVITPDTDVKGTIAKDVRVLIRYTGTGSVKTAVSVEKVLRK